MPLPSEWVDRLFSRFGAMYGAQWAEKWRGFDVDEVKKVWAEDLGSFSGEQIKRALDHARKNCSFPPSCPEFASLCRQFRGDQSNVLYLAAPVSKMPPHIVEQLRDFANRKTVGHVKQKEYDPRGWAKRILLNPKDYPFYSQQLAREAMGLGMMEAS
jgi:DNA polymerase III delta prime subunit